MIAPRDQNFHIKSESSQYFALQVLSQQWAQPIDRNHSIYPATSDVSLVTVYPLLRPDGLWSVMLVNKDHDNSQSVTVGFHNRFTGQDLNFPSPVTPVTFSPAQYVSHSNGVHGYPLPDTPAKITTQNEGAGTHYTLPASSLTVLRGGIQ